MKNIKNIFLLYIIILNLFFFISIKCSELSEIGKHLIFNLKIEANKDNKLLAEDNYMSEIMYKHLYSKFNIGIPSQRLKFYYETNCYNSSIIEEDYNKQRSTTYHLIEKNIINKFILSQEIFEIDKDKTLNFTFLLKEKNSGNLNNKNILGLNLNINNNHDNLSFLSQLKQNNYIDQKIFTFLFGDNIIMENRGFDGQILIGCLPHDINPIFEEKDLKWISTNNKKKWNINFDLVKYNNDEIKDKNVDLDLTLNLIIGPETFRQKLLNDFFKLHIENKKCKENFFYNLKDEQFYIYYSCNNDAEFIEIPNLSFYHKELNETFKISFENLFVNFRYRYYFNIIFKKNPQNNWVFGQLFFNNYRFVFDLEKERIGYYKTYPQKDHPMIAIFSFALIFIISGIGYLYGYINKNENEQLKNKQIIYPLRREYSDISQNNKEEKNDKNNKSNILEKKEKQN